MNNDPMILDNEEAPRTPSKQVLTVPKGRQQGSEGNTSQNAPQRAAKLVGHEAYIESMRRDKAEVRVEMMSGSSTTGTITAADKYTISLSSSTHPVEIIYKHAIARLFPTKRGAKK